MAGSTFFSVLFAVLLLGTSSASTSDAPTVWDVLEEYGLPRGLLPASVSSFSLREEDRFFTVTLPSPCYIKFADLVYYDTKITGYLNFGSIRQLTGIQTQRFFFWFPVSSVELDFANQQLEFKVGIVSQNYPLADFSTVKSCQKNRCGSSCRGVGGMFVS